MSSNRPKIALPLSVIRELKRLGADISVARRRRRITAQMLAERASVSRGTLRKIERGDPGVAMGSYATVLFVLGLEKKLGALAAPSTDEVGLELEEAHLPKRVRPRKLGDSR